MESIKIENLTFTYPSNAEPSLKNIFLTVEKGEFITICGKSGCGKSTLLRHLKPPIAPCGERCGKIAFEGQDVFKLSSREQTEKIGFVMQSADNQIATDKVWHELAFGLESLGYTSNEIRARVAETAAFFGISDWFYQKTEFLSGGQKQLLNLASIMVLQPSLLILDEPTSQLDPIAAREFLQNVSNINKELGTTVILTEHRLEEVFNLSDKVVVMENGEIIAHGTPKAVCKKLYEIKSDMTLALPTPARIFSAVESEGCMPLTVREGRDWLGKKEVINHITNTENSPKSKNAAIELKNVWFRYEKNLPDVLKGLSAKIFEGEHYAVLGGNGAGKSTFLAVSAGLCSPYRGKINIYGNKKIVYLAQNPQTLFVKKTVRDDLCEILPKNTPNRAQKLENIIDFCNLSPLLDRHPYDLSGGEQQRAALAKVLLTDPDILLLDEPTKGLDAHFKEKLAELLKNMQKSGITIITVSHDIEFCAKYADRCAMFFDGQITSEDEPRKFFGGKSFYTTAANRMSRKIIDNAVLENDIIFALGGKVKNAKIENETTKPLLKTHTQSKKSEKQKQKRRISPIRIVFGSLFAVLFLLTLVFPLYTKPFFSSLFGSTGEGMPQILSILLLAASLAFFIPQKKIGIENAKSGSEKLTKRTVFSSVFVLLAVPLTVIAGVYLLGDRKFYFISLAVILETLLPFIMVFEGRKPQAREIVIISVLCALAVAGRTAFYMLPQFKPIIAIIIISAVCFGGETGFLVGAVSGFVSNFFFSQGPWTPWQMFALGLVGFISGIIYQKSLLPKTKLSLTVFGFFAALIIYGGIMNPASVIMYQPYPTAKLIISSYWLGFPFDLVHAVSTAFFMWFISEPMIDKLERVKIKYGLVKSK